MGVTKKKSIIRASNIFKEYPTGQNQKLEVLKGLDLEVSTGEILVVVGPSGSGKSTLLHILGGIERPTKGVVQMNGQNVFLMNDEKLATFRNKSLGFIFQFHHLLPEFNALENVLMPAFLLGEPKKSASGRARELLAEVGLGERIQHFPSELSGGEQQRVAVARALMNEPSVILADEPSGNLDEANGLKLHNLLIDISRIKETTFIIATHNQDLTSRGSRVLRLTNGRLVPAEN